VKTLIIKARRSLRESDADGEERASSFIEAVRSLDRAAAKGVLHPNNAARRKSRLARKLAALAAAAPAPAAAASGKGKRAAASAPSTKKK
jgi:small subunit ribosomal protein S20